MKKLNWLFLFFFSFAFLACDDDEDVTLDTTNPTITISSPTTGQSFSAGDVVELRARVEDNMGLEEIRVYVTDPSGTKRQIEDEDISDFLNDNRNKDLELDVTLDGAAPAGAYTMTIEADDEAGNMATASVTITVM